MSDKSLADELRARIADLRRELANLANSAEERGETVSVARNLLGFDDVGLVERVADLERDLEHLRSDAGRDSCADLATRLVAAEAALNESQERSGLFESAATKALAARDELKAEVADLKRQAAESRADARAAHQALMNADERVTAAERAAAAKDAALQAPGVTWQRYSEEVQAGDQIETIDNGSPCHGCGCDRDEDGGHPDCACACIVKDALRADAGRGYVSHEAVREQAIAPHHGGEGVMGTQCYLCRKVWLGEKEIHGDDCLAAPEGEKP